MIGVVAALALAAAPPSAPPDGSAGLGCRVIGVSGANFEFAMELKGDPDSGQARIAKPGAAFVPASEGRFPVRDLPTSLFFDLLPLSGSPGHYVVTIFLDVDGRPGFPAAGGYCLPGRAEAASAAAPGFGALNEAALVKAADDHQPCFLLTPDGQVSRFNTHLVPRGEEHDRVFEPLDSKIWPAKRASPEMGLPPMPLVGVVPVQLASIFHVPEASPNPTGLSTAYIDPERALAVGTMQFTSLGRKGPGLANKAYGLCAIRLKRDGK